MGARFHAFDEEGVGTGAHEFFAHQAVGAKHRTFAPPSLIRWMLAAEGTPPAKTICETFSARQTSIRASSCGCIVMRFTPKGLGVSARVA